MKILKTAICDVWKSKKKIILCIGIYILLFVAGVLSASIGSIARASKLENRVDSLTEKLAESARTIGTIRDENYRITELNRELESANNEFRNDIAELQRINNEFTEIVWNLIESNNGIRESIKNADTGIGGVIQGMSAYIEKAKSAE